MKKYGSIIHILSLAGTCLISAWSGGNLVLVRNR